VDYVRSAASGFIFTTSLPPAVAAAIHKSICILREDNHLRQQLWHRVHLLKQLLLKSGLPYTLTESHIIPVVVGDALRCREVCDILSQEFGIYAQPINYPTVPRGQERLRLTVTPFHTPAMIQQLVDALTQIWSRLDLRIAA
jgi:5-aminolevulinate synthase